ncbi:MAG: aminopeptidase P N-terminal domain-containing protein, partial [Gemmatimonadota bacterium]
MNRPDPIDIPQELVELRRRAVFDRLGRGVMVLPAASVQYSSRDGERPYHPDRELYYVTGATEPETVAVLLGGPEPSLTLFVRDRDETAEAWSGARLGVSGASERFRPDECLPLKDLDEKLPELLWQGDRIFFRLGRGDAVERHVLETLHRARMRGPRSGNGPRGVVDPGEILDDLRLIKDAYEIEAIRRGVDLSVAGHRAAAAAIAPGVGEWVVEGALEEAFRAGGGTGPAYESIVGSGRKACVLHYVANRDTIGEDELVLIDAGAEYALYHGDVTRTYPSGGRFTGPQRDVYQIVESARVAAVAAVVPGATIVDVHVAATEVLVEGLVGLGVLSGTVSEILEERSHKKYYLHQTSHWLGLDVHDVGDYARGGRGRQLEPGMVFTIEPGLYF